MELPKFTRFLWFYLTLLLAFSHGLTADETDKQEGQLVPKTPLAPDSLQIELNRNLYDKDKSILYSSHLQFDEKPDISDSQLYQIATDAYKEMQDRAKAYPRAIARSVPNVMTTLFIGNELIFASSAKGWRELFEEGDDVVGDLQACSDANGGKPHKNNGRCGEVNTFHEWYKSHVSSERLGKDSGAKIVAISMFKNADGTKEPQIMAPCGDDDNWGCNKFINGMYTLDNDKVAVDPRKDAFAYKKLLAEKKLKPAPTRPAQSAANPVPAAPNKQNSKPGPPVNHLAPANPPPAAPNRQNSKPGSIPGPPVNHLAPANPPLAPVGQQNSKPGSKPGPPVNHLAPANPPLAPVGQQNSKPGSKSGPPVNHLAPANPLPAAPNKQPGSKPGPPVNHLAPGNRVPPNPSRPNAQPVGGNNKPSNNRPVNNGKPAISRPPSGGAGGPKGH